MTNPTGGLDDDTLAALEAEFGNAEAGVTACVRLWFRLENLEEMLEAMTE
ncbi:hypothetical protein [Halopelagius fulvigenes]|uniref:Uncharacterized protein n=1 Tax=Halopelagius fulvigenes TaxID=1198324 RepID=A0ABD5U1F9_9EURY